MAGETIRMRTGVAVFNNENQLLLVPHYVQGKVLWYPPGGGVEYLERIEDAAIREYKEETGFDIELTSSADTIQLIDPIESWHSISFLFQAKIIGGELQAEASPWGDKLPVWYNFKALDDIELVDYIEEWIKDCF